MPSSFRLGSQSSFNKCFEAGDNSIIINRAEPKGEVPLLALKLREPWLIVDPNHRIEFMAVFPTNPGAKSLALAGLNNIGDKIQNQIELPRSTFGCY
jgi:hypothetical protein